MTIKRKAEVRKAAPNITKSFIDIAIGIIVGWALFGYAVDSFEGVRPNVGIVTIILKLLNDFGFMGAGGLLARWLFEIYRKRK